MAAYLILTKWHVSSVEVIRSTVGLVFQIHYGSCEGPTGTLNKLTNRGLGKRAEGQSLTQTCLLTTEAERPYVSSSAKINKE